MQRLETGFSCPTVNDIMSLRLHLKGAGELEELSRKNMVVFYREATEKELAMFRTCLKGGSIRDEVE